MPEFFGVNAIYFGNELANEGLLVKSCVVGAKEVESGSEEAMMIHLKIIQKINKQLKRYILHDLFILCKHEKHVFLF